MKGARVRNTQLSPKTSSEQLCYGHCLCDSAPHSSSNNNCGVHWLLHNGEVPTVLTELLFWWWSTGSSVIPGRIVWSSQHFLLCPIPNRPSHFCGRKATCLQKSSFHCLPMYFHVFCSTLGGGMSMRERWAG